MQSIALPAAFDTLSDDDRSSLLTNRGLRSLADVFATLPDPRSRHGKRYELAFLLTCLMAALLCGCNSVDAVGQWCAEHRSLLRRTFGRRRHLSPTGALYRWLLPQLDAARLEWALAGWIATTRPTHDHEAIALDGKVICGAGHTIADQPKLLSVSTHQTHETLVQVRVPQTTTEIPIAQQLLPWMALHHRVVTADAAHCQREFAQAVLDGGGHYLLCLKGNRPALYADALTYFDDPTAVYHEASSMERHRGRREERCLRVTSELAGYIDAIPGVAQVAQLTRTTERTPGVIDQTTDYYLTSCPSHEVDAAALLTLIRGHWGIESHHWIRDLVFGEDRSTLRSGPAPQIMAALRNAAETLIRRSGRPGITAARRHLAAHPAKAFTLIRRRFPARA